MPAPERRATGPVLRWLLWPVGVLAGAVAALALSLWLTPMQNVSAAGQTVQVGVTAPSWSLRGPGELDLFGQSIPTTVQFDGPVRPRLALSRITLTDQLAQLTHSSPASASHDLQHALVDGFRRFFAWQLAVAAAVALVLFGAVAGWLRRRPRTSVVLIVVGVVVTLALDAGAIMYTAYTAPRHFRDVSSLQSLVGSQQPVAPDPDRDTTTGPVRRLVVLGDSTAAGLGLPPVSPATAADTACRRSGEAYADALAASAGWSVTNLACSGATIPDGLLGAQSTRGTVLPAQIEDAAVRAADAVVVSVGANDLHWADLLKLCAVSESCSNSAEQAFLQQQLNVFSANLLELVSRLQLLPNHPIVVVTQYYDPFDGQIGCLTHLGLTQDKLEALESDLSAMNAILAAGAKAAGFLTTRPDFTGHGVCSTSAYVQGVRDSAPFHPTASGELAIALAVSRALTPAG